MYYALYSNIQLRTYQLECKDSPVSLLLPSSLPSSWDINKTRSPTCVRLAGHWHILISYITKYATFYTSDTHVKQVVLLVLGVLHM